MKTENWSELMQRVIEINLLDDYRYTVEIQSMDITIHDNTTGGYIYNAMSKFQPCDLFKGISEAVNEFFKWHNNKSK